MKFCSNYVATKVIHFSKLMEEMVWGRFLLCIAGSETYSKYCAVLWEKFLLLSSLLHCDQCNALQQNCLCGKVLIWIKGGERVVRIGSRSLSTPQCRITIEIRCVIMIALPFPDDKGVNGCLCSIQRDYSSTALCIIKWKRRHFGKWAHCCQSDEETNIQISCLYSKYEKLQPADS